MFATHGFDAFGGSSYGGGYSAGGYEENSGGANAAPHAPYTPNVKASARQEEQGMTTGRKKEMRHESTVPVTLGQLLAAHRRRAQPDSDPLLINGQEATNVTFVAQVTRNEARKISQCFAVADQRGVIAVEKYFHSENPALKERLASIPLGAYVRVVGVVRSRSQQKAAEGKEQLQAAQQIYVSAQQVRLVTDPAEVFCHDLEAAWAHAKATGMTAGEAHRKSVAARKSHGAVSASQEEYRDTPPTPLGPMSQEAPEEDPELLEGADELTCPAQRAALAMLRRHDRQAADEYGLSAADLAERCGYRHSESALSAALAGLQELAHVYETDAGRYKCV